MKTPGFPPGFAWGAATAAWQIEGSTRAEGRGASIWDAFAEAGGTIIGERGDPACDSYRRWADDVALLRSLGATAYRMSISWTRILPEGRGRVNQAGLDHYRRCIDQLLEAGITPHVTLFHWDTPLALDREYGGWLDRRIVEDAGAYAAVVVRALGDRVSDWMTVNEIPSFSLHAYTTAEPHAGIHAPGRRVGSMREIWQAAWHGVLAHGRMVQAIRANTPRPCRVALVDNTGIPVPLIADDQHNAAARRAFPSLYGNGLIIYPALTGTLAPEWVTAHEKELPGIQAEDLALASQPIDRLALNIYSGTIVEPADNAAGWQALPWPARYPTYQLDWLKLVPEALYWGPRLVREVLGFRNPIIIGENGCPGADTFAADGRVHDLERILYMRAGLSQVQRACADGYGVEGFFAWTLLDNVEWGLGSTARLGLVHTDFTSGRRTPKDSFAWYRSCIAANQVL